ncbi:hypothetical protein NSMM_150127 [Nitrosomonas mobilis]|uniref:Transposase n=1 Tax=Nitrosomonas mobilis TaxID=51642 RepID=A0A1G5SD99_9PROT|nr:hypothetical protein NSMM_150127 [Nitrosomonas mobilis]
MLALVAYGCQRNAHMVRRACQARDGGNRVHGILPRRMATLVHDCWKPYWKLECVYALCNAHLLHKLVFLHERTGQTWPQRMLDMLISAHDACAAARPVTAVLT